MNYKYLAVWVGFLVGVLALSAQGKAVEDTVFQQVQQAVDEAQFVNINADWEVVTVESGHFRVREKHVSCPAVLTPTSALVPSMCFLPASQQGIALPKDNILLQRVLLSSVQGKERNMTPRFKKLPAWYTAVGSQEPAGEEGQVYTTWQKNNRRIISTHDVAIREGNKVFMFAGPFASAAKDPDLQLESAYFQSRSGVKKNLSLQYAHKGQWTVLTLQGR